MKSSKASSSSEYSNFPDNTHLEINETFQEMIGHVNIQTTICYVSLAKEQLHKDVVDRSWFEDIDFQGYVALSPTCYDKNTFATNDALNG